MSRVAAARRQRGLWGQSNHRQHLVSQPDLEAQAEAENETAAPGSARASLSLRNLRHAMSTRMALPANVPSSGYEFMRMDYGVDLQDISALTTFHTGRITAQLLAREPHRLMHVLRCRQINNNLPPNLTRSQLPTSPPPTPTHTPSQTQPISHNSLKPHQPSIPIPTPLQTPASQLLSATPFPSLLSEPT